MDFEVPSRITDILGNYLREILMHLKRIRAVSHNNPQEDSREWRKNEAQKEKTALFVHNSYIAVAVNSLEVTKTQ